MEKKNKISWIDDARKITSILIVLMIAIIILSQSFAINNNLSTIDILKNIVKIVLRFFCISSLSS